MKSDEENSKIKKYKNNNKKTIISNKQTIIKTKTNLRYTKPLWNQKKYQVGIWCQPRVKQSLDQRNQHKLKNFPSLVNLLSTHNLVILTTVAPVATTITNPAINTLSLR